MKGDKIYYKSGYKYQLCKQYSIQTLIYPATLIMADFISLQPCGLLIIDKGYAWDGASGPTLDTKSSMRGSLVHDALYQLMRLGLIPENNREYADKLLHDICVEDGMNKLRAHIWKDMVESFATSCAKSGTERCIEEAP